MEFRCFLFRSTVLARRQEISWLYRHRLKEVKGIKIPEEPSQSSVNHAYFPILVEPDYPLGRDGLYQRLKDNNIFARRYFYPLISEFPMYRGMPSARREVLPIASDLSARSEEHTSELQSLMRISYAVFCLKKKNYKQQISQTI